MSADSRSDDDPEMTLLRVAVEQGRDSIRQGRVLPHERVRGWLKALAEGAQVPHPRADMASFKQIITRKGGEPPRAGDEVGES